MTEERMRSSVFWFLNYMRIVKIELRDIRFFYVLASP